MVGRTDSLQTAPNLHDRMWELDGFGDYVKHSFQFQFIVRRRGITFTQMERNLERHSFCATQNVYGKGGGGGPFKEKKNGKKRFIVFIFFLKLALVFCSLHVAGQWCHGLHHSQVLRGPSWCLLWSGPSILTSNWRSTHVCALIRSCVILHLPLTTKTFP